MKKYHLGSGFLGACTVLLLIGLTAQAWAAEVSQSVAAPNVMTCRYDSSALGEQRSFNIILPTNYAHSTHRYPVLYLLHGYGDDHTAWSYMTDLSGFAADLNVIIVMPDASRSFYVNSAGDPKARFEDMIIKDLIPYVDSHFRTIPLPRCRAVAGLSMGGYGAAFLGLKHYRQFAAVGSFSGAVARAHIDPVDESKLDDNGRKKQQEMVALFGTAGSNERKERDPFALIEKIPAGQVPALYICCGGQDFLLNENRMFVDHLAKLKIPYEYREISPKSHSWDFWNDHVKEFLQFVKGCEGFRSI